MGQMNYSGVWRGSGPVRVLLLYWIFTVVPPSLPQSPFPLSLPVHMSVVPSPWQFLPLSQAELGPLFSNSSPFSFSQSFFMMPPPGQTPRPGLQASFGPYSVTQLISDHVLPLSHPLFGSLLSEHVDRERDEGGQERFTVKAMFHKHGNAKTQGTCVTLHAFKDTEERRESCITQPPLGLCVVTLTLPSYWFKGQYTNQSHQDFSKQSIIPSRRRLQKRDRKQGRHHLSRQESSLPRYGAANRGKIHSEVPRALRYQRGLTMNQIQLYYSSFDTKITKSSCVTDQMPQAQRQLFHIKAVTLKEDAIGQKKGKVQSGTKEESCLNGQEVEELNLDPHVLISYHRGPVLIGQPIRVSVNVRANFSAEFVVIRLKVKKGLVSMVAQRTLTSDLWAVTMERTQGSKHDIVSILCLKASSLKHNQNPTVFQQVVCLSIDGLKRSFGVAMAVAANWWVEYSGHSSHQSPHGAAVSTFSFTDRPIIGIAPTTESKTIINTAILTNKPVSLPVIVLAISRDGRVSDVTSAVTCRSTNEDILKVSNDCSSLFVDGSESGLGSLCAVVEFLLGTLSGSVCLEVWAPSVPLLVSVTDPILNVIDGWNHLTQKGCVPVYQRSSVQVLTQFTAKDVQGRTTNLLGSSDWFMDVTELVHNWLRVEDPRVASISHNTLIGLHPGVTTVHVVAEQWDGVLGSCDITVSADTVTPGDLSVQVISGLGMSVTGSAIHPSIVTATVTAYNILYNLHQEASISIWLQFSDDTASPLSSFGDLPYFLHLSSLADTVVVVTPDTSHRIFAQGDGGGPLLRAELLTSSCNEWPINSIGEGEMGTKDEAEGARWLAKGSGWIRVNLELDFLQLGRNDEDSEEFKFDISDMLTESESEVYPSKLEKNEDDERENASMDNDYDNSDERRKNDVRNGRTVSRNTLEKAVLMPSPEDSAVYFSPSQENGDKNDRQSAHELQVGLGAVLSLLCLFMVLFLANCLPCALRDRKRKLIEGETDKELEQGVMLEEEEAKKNKVDDEEKSNIEDCVKLQENNKGVKELVIIC